MRTLQGQMLMSQWTGHQHAAELTGQRSRCAYVELMVLPILLLHLRTAFQADDLLVLDMLGTRMLLRVTQILANDSLPTAPTGDRGLQAVLRYVSHHGCRHQAPLAVHTRN
eukprot:GILJ01009496.1.p2 GENE.GILJ01009496.1~~GILJ01009496.1.p2  ORF type:complete len:111 (-),score=8.52 GILJ01009496.1:509-841(-)